MSEEKVVSETEKDEEESLVIKFSKPYMFERTEYKEIDLSPLEDITAADMIATNKFMGYAGGAVPEVTLEYACVLAARAVNKPVEFFTNMPPKEAMKVKNRVMGFLFG